MVISHGNGGGPGSHADLVLALANAGYVVAAPMHTGDNYADQHRRLGWPYQPSIFAAHIAGLVKPAP